MNKVLQALLMIMLLALWAGCGAAKEEGAGQDKNTPAVATEGKKAEVTLQVEIKKMAPERFEHYFQINGSVEAVKEAFISPETGGQVKKIHVSEGQRVSKGQLLVSLNSETLRAGIDEVRSQLELAKTVYERQAGLWEKKIGSEVQFLQAKANREAMESRLKSMNGQLAMMEIKAPISGIVDEVARKEGELAAPGAPLLTLVDLSRVYVNADVAESYLSKINKGDAVQVTFPAFPGMMLEAKIHRIGNVVKPQNRTFLAQLALDNPDEKLKPNMVAVIRLRDFLSEAALTAPSIIIKNDINGSFLYTVDRSKSPATAQKAYVETGMSEGSQTMILKGLEPGQEIIISGYQLVKNGLPVLIRE